MTALVAQPTCKQYLKAGDEAYGSGDYNSAMNYYGSALNLSNDNPELLYKYGSAAFDANAFDKSSSSLGTLVETLENTEYPDAVYKLAKSREMMGNYDDAEKYYDMYVSEYGDGNPMYVEMAQMAKDAGAWAASQPSDNEELTVTRLGGEVNSQYGEYSPFLMGDDLYFTSHKFGGGKCESCSTFGKILKSTNSKNAKEVKGAGAWNNAGMATSSPSFTADGTGVYYTMCELLSAENLRCDIYYASVEDGVVGEGTKLDLNQDGVTSTHPAIAEDGTLYFASDRAGGKGGLDIYKASIGSDMSSSGVMNMADVNTPGDDLSPFYHNRTNTLYFASNGRMGFGGLDIYSLSSNGDIANEGAEVNTSANDFYYMLSDDGVNGYLTSNRPGSLFLDDNNQTCCYDIYHAVYERCEIELMNMVYDKSTGEKLNGANLTIVDNSTGELIYDSTKDDTNEFPTSLPCENSYTVTACKDGYICDVQTVGPIEGKAGIQKLDLDLNLVPAILNVCACDNASGGDLQGGTISMFDATNGKAVAAMDGTGACKKFAIGPDTDYRITVRKGSSSETKEFNSGDMRSLQLNQKICLDIIATCSSLIPVRLYFDNDHPNPRSTSETSDLTYTDTYNSYNPKRGEFITKYGGQFGNKGRDAAEGDVARFFDQDVRGGYDNFQALLSCLTEILQGGSSANLFLRGYASPLSRDKYNEALGKRRVDVVRNEIERYRGGILKPFLANGQLKVTERSFGESTSPNGVSDSASNRRKSVYSPEASRERRVEIDEIRFDN